MKIGIIGAGNIGGTVGKLLANAGHEVRYGVRNPQAVGDEAGTPVEAAAFADVLIFAGPFGAWPDFAAENAAALAGKVVTDASNPYPDRDGEMAQRVAGSGQGSARFVAELLPAAHVVKAFNTIYWIDLRDQAGRAGKQLAMPIAGDAADSLDIAVDLARDAGFDPVIVGGLDRSSDLDPGSAIYAKSMTAAAVRTTLGLSA